MYSTHFVIGFLLMCTSLCDRVSVDGQYSLCDRVSVDDSAHFVIGIQFR